MDASDGFSDFRRETDGQVTAVNGAGERVNVRLTVESQVTRADGTVERAREVASSDVPEGALGSVSVG